jgi:DNA-binding transcriptional regulator YhcF (GntR family)
MINENSLKIVVISPCYPVPVVSAHDNRRDHAIRGPLERVVKEAQSKNHSAKQLVESILEELDEQNIIAYTPKSNVNLLTPAGRILIYLIETPGLTVRELSTTLGVTSTAVIKALSLLTKNKLIARTKVKGRYEYRINLNNTRYHPDLRRLIRTISAVLESSNVISP